MGDAGPRGSEINAEELDSAILEYAKQAFIAGGMWYVTVSSVLLCIAASVLPSCY